MESVFHTKLCDLLGIKYPIIQGAMAYFGGPELSAAVSNAGGLGILPTWAVSLDQLRESIQKIRTLTSNPFGVNIVPLGQGFAQSRAEVVIEEGVTIVTTGRGDPREPIVSLLKSHGIKVLGVVPNVRLALRLEAEGVDAIVASGCEAGGHVGSVSTLPLIPQVVDSVKVPVVTAGGIADERGFLAALILGACGIQMGTRFLVSNEAQTSIKQRQKIIEVSDEGTIITSLYTGKPTRVLKTLELEEYQRHEQAGASVEELKNLAKETIMKVREDTEMGAISLGQIAGLVKSVQSVKEIIEDIIGRAANIYLAIIGRYRLRPAAIITATRLLPSILHQPFYQ